MLTNSDKKGSISQLQFDLKTADETAVKYFYYPIITAEGASDFETFHAQIISAKFSMTHSTAATESILSYSWLNDYRQIGEVKQELKRRENEYIVFKDFMYVSNYNYGINSVFYLFFLNYFLVCIAALGM